MYKLRATYVPHTHCILIEINLPFYWSVTHIPFKAKLVKRRCLDYWRFIYLISLGLLDVLPRNLIDAIRLCSSYHEHIWHQFRYWLNFLSYYKMKCAQVFFRCFWFEINNMFWCVSVYIYIYIYIYIYMYVYCNENIQCYTSTIGEVALFNIHNKNQIIFGHYSCWRIVLSMKAPTDNWMVLCLYLLSPCLHGGYVFG